MHVCCAPDATVAAERLLDDYFVGVYFYNPNIHPRKEYLKRVEDMERLAPLVGVFLHSAPYDTDKWIEAVRGLEHEREGGKRCEVCFFERLEKTALSAKRFNYDFFGTVLTVSPHKNADLINSIGEKIAKKIGITYFPSNFKKQDGFKRSIELSKQYNLYRQDYCGCKYSRIEREEVIRQKELVGKNETR